MATLSRITIYPIKSCDGVALDQCRVLPSGALAGDRRWALVDEQGEFVNGKREPRIHRIRTTFDWESQLVSCATDDSPAETFHLAHDVTALAAWFSRHLRRTVRIQVNAECGWPDDLDAPGPTVIGQSTLAQVAEWFPGLSVEETRRRFRANLEISDTEPFWEDAWVGESGNDVLFSIGDLEFGGVNPCQRCVVPTRSPETGEPIAQFVRRFSEFRERTLPSWSPRGRFDHFYRLALNTRLRRLGSGWLRVGDRCE